MSAEILIYAVVAAGLIFWLRSILGTRHGGERQRPNPFTAPPPGETSGKPQIRPQQQDRPADVMGLQGDDAGLNPVPPVNPLALPSDGRITLGGPAVETALLALVRLDRGFTLTHFVTGAQDAFVMIVEAFAAGDRDLLKSLLSRDLYTAFDSAITAREAEGQTMMTEIHAIRKTEITDCQLQGKMAYVTLRFVADETSVIRDRDGAAVSGHPDRVSETIDIWTFGRDPRSKDPTWFLIATREEESGATSIPSV